MEQRIMTDRQADIYQFICDTLKKNTYSPTVREIGEEFGIRSPNGVVAHLRALERKGMITRQARMSRSIRLVGGSGKCPVCGGRMKS